MSDFSQSSVKYALHPLSIAIFTMYSTYFTEIYVLKFSLLSSFALKILLISWFYISW